MDSSHQPKNSNTSGKKKVQPLSEEEQWELSQIRQFKSRLNAKPIGSVMRKLMTQRGYGQTQAAEQLAEYWPLAAGEVLAVQTRPGNVSRGILTVHVTDSVAMQELNFVKKQIIARLQKELPEMKISGIRGRISN